MGNKKQTKNKCFVFRDKQMSDFGRNEDKELGYDERLVSSFWKTQFSKVDKEKYHNFSRDNGAEDHKALLPLARIKKVMRTDKEIQKMMIASEVPILFSKLCELFIVELTLHGWIQTEEGRRKTLQKEDICNAIPRFEIYDFLIDIIPRDSRNDDEITGRHYDAFFKVNQEKNMKNTINLYQEGDYALTPITDGIQEQRKEPLDLFFKKEETNMFSPSDY